MIKWILKPLLFVFAMLSVSWAQVSDEKFEHWPVDLKINGKVVVAGALKDVQVLRTLVRASDRKKKTAVVMASTADETKTAFKELFAESAELQFHNSPETSKEIETLLRQNDVVVFHSAKPLSKKLANDIILTKSAFHEFLGSGKLIIALGGAAEIVSQSYFDSNDTPSSEREGLNLLPDCLLKTDFNGAADQKQLLSALTEKKHSVGIGLNKQTALILSGRKMRVAGPGKATFILKGNEREKARVHSISAPNQRSRNPENILLDLTQWRLDAIGRALPQFPAKEPREPIVKNGTLIIVGGGGSPRGMTSEFIQLAGGVKNAKLVYIPCSESEDVGDRHGLVQRWKRAGVKHATFIHTKDRNQANSDEDFLKPLREATGIYFGGGRQWNFSDSYYGTEAHKLMKKVLERGGVIAGSSAGASIQGRYLARATPIGNSKIRAFGYERGGLGFLDGVAIDQHFSQRNRFRDMTGLMKRYPQLLGIGIDEATAIVVQKSKAEVIGRGEVHFYDHTEQVPEGKLDYVSLSAGSTYDLAKRRVLKNSIKKSPDER